MERDLLVMLYGAIMGVVGSLVTSIVTAVFHFWLERREYDRRQSEERQRQLNQIHLPTDEEVRMINADQYEEHQPEARAAAEAGSVIFSILVGSAVVYQTRDTLLLFAFGACLGFLLTRRILRSFKR